MAGIDVGSGGGKQREVNQEVNMIPFIDMLLVTVAFLLITAVWVTFSRMEARANLPGPEQGPITHTEKTMHVFVEKSSFVVSWRQGSTVISETRMPKLDPAGIEPRYDELGELLAREWEKQGSHRDPSDMTRDLAVLHTENALPFAEMVAVMDAIHHAKRDAVIAGERRKVPAFGMALASR